MMAAQNLIEIWRGDFLESQHRGHAVICNASGGIVRAWGNPDLTILPRSSCKMIQALPLVLSGAAHARGLTSQQLALACASHQGAAIHTDLVQRWLQDLGKTDDDLRCGPQTPNDITTRDGLVKSDTSPCRYHNNCSGKHCGFLTLSDHLGAGPEYHNPDHPVQRAVKDMFEWATGETTPGFGIDGCSAPNFTCSITGLARAAAKFAGAVDGGSAEDQAMVALRNAMMAHPELVAGQTRACTELMQATPGVALKTGAEAVFVAIIPAQQLGIAVKIEDGSFRASEAMIAALLIDLGLLDANHPNALRRVGGPIRNWDGLETGKTVIAPGVL